ncbi:hypothetical protein GCM10018781_27140 [Kitasatospora indigofera]|uniref:Uncharacterized protein n=1 Tax=Kitasatospora indigofera TaxID=67307 RepID=A0A919FMJ3_9ACTN|nr:hypothetical protein GCM10018781_27140 [Kitasatospora indigofera]
MSPDRREDLFAVAVHQTDRVRLPEQPGDFLVHGVPGRLGAGLHLLRVGAETLRGGGGGPTGTSSTDRMGSRSLRGRRSASPTLRPTSWSGRDAECTAQRAESRVKTAAVDRPGDPAAGSGQGAAARAAVISLGVDDTNTAITSANFAHSGNRGYGDYQNDIHHATANGSTASFTFTGAGIQARGERSTNRGNIGVGIDGGAQQPVNTCPQTVPGTPTSPCTAPRPPLPGQPTLVATKLSGRVRHPRRSQHLRQPGRPVSIRSTNPGPTATAVGPDASGDGGWRTSQAQASRPLCSGIDHTSSLEVPRDGAGNLAATMSPPGNPRLTSQNRALQHPGRTYGSTHRPPGLPLSSPCLRSLPLPGCDC